MDDDRGNQSRSQPSPAKPGSGEGKMCIKLKIPNMEEGLVVVGDDDQIGRPQRNDQPRVCNVCDKWFSSGKALGGHMRVHVQANKEESLKKLKINHQQQSKKKDRPQLVVDLPEKTDTDNAGDSPTCSLCGKNFPSMKSLFGHMRCHPEREWRGIQPPPGAKNSSSSTTTSSVSDTTAAAPEPRKVNDDSDDAVGFPEIELTKCLLPSWSVTARRGRRALVTASASASASVLPTTEEEEKEKLNDAVQDLMRLAQGDSLESWPSGLTRKLRVEESDSEATNSDSPTNKAEIEDMNWVLESKKQQKRPRIEEEEKSPPAVENAAKKLRIDERGSTARGMLVKIVNKGKRKAVFEAKYDPRKTVGSGHEWVNVDDDSDCKISDISTRPVTIKSKKKRKKLKLTELESVRDGTAPADQVRTPIETTTPPPLDRYKCSTCDKSFPTHQALGGHRSSHNKVKNSPTIDDSSSPAAEPITRIDETKEDEGGGGGGGGVDSSTKLAAEGIHHQCKICSKNFPTGQALGGHQRCHWNGTCPPPAEAPSSQPTSPDTGRKILGFDLNELPAMEDEESGSQAAGGGGGGYDCASSSRNSGSAA